MNDRNGRLVALCGIDASGKTTQTERLEQRARRRGLAVGSISFPRYGEGFFADLIQRYLRGEFAERPGDVSPYLAALPYGCDRWQARPQLLQWLAEGRLVICNRYVAANLAHQGSKLPDPESRREFFRWDSRMEYEVFDMPPPDLQILLDMPPPLAVELRQGRDLRRGVAEEVDIHEADLDYLRATCETYRQVAEETPGPWAVVECAEGGAVLPPERIADRVWAHVKEIV